MISAEQRLQPLMVKGLAGDAAAYRALLEALGMHLRAYFARRLGLPVPPTRRIWCRKR